MMLEILLMIMTFLSGCVCGYVFINNITDGNLIINKTDPEKDIYRLEIEDLDKIEKKSVINIRVIMEGNKDETREL